MPQDSVQFPALELVVLKLVVVYPSLYVRVTVGLFLSSCSLHFFFFEMQLNFAMLDKAKLCLCFTIQSPVVI